MKRIGDEIIEEIIQDSNIRNSIRVVLRGTRRKRTRIGRCILKYEDKFIRSIAMKIKNGTFRVEKYHEMLVTDGPKVRRVQAIPIFDRIACHAIMTVVEEHIFKKYIRTTGASIKNRGAHDLITIILRDLKNDTNGMRYFYSSDYKKFYESINQDFMMFSLRRMFKGKIILSIFESFVRMMPTGISIGLRSSQAFGNLMLSLHLDHYVKDRMRWKRYYRYCDDIHVAAKTKEEIWQFRKLMHKKSDYMGLTIKPNERIFPITEGLDALGYIVSPNIIRLRKRNKQNFARKIKKLKSKRRRNELTAAFYGICKHGNCRNLFYQLTGIKMKDFKDLKIKPKYQDNKKRFSAQCVSIQDLNGVTVEILDFEKGVIPNWQANDYKQKLDKVKAKYQLLLEKYKGEIPDDIDYETPESIKKPEGRYVVFINSESGKQKFFTGDRGIWSILDQAQEQGEIPFRTTIRKVPGQSNKYQFT